MTASAATTAAEAEKRTFNLPRGDAALTLKQFAAAAGTPIIYLVDRVRGATTNAVRGELTPREALERMLVNSGLEAAQDGTTGAFVVSRKHSEGKVSPAPNPKPQPRTQTMKSHRTLLAVLAGWLATATITEAQNLPVSPTAANQSKEEVLQLSPFTVTSSGDVGRYTSLESTSAGRVRLNIMDSSQNVSVITSDVLRDVGATRILDATKYIAGIAESTLPNAQDRTSIRGFQSDGYTMDGFTTAGASTVDPYLIDRIEVVKGPNSILSPQPTSPGGTVNLASKKPQFRDFADLMIQAGRYDATAAAVDLNRKVSDKIAVRMVASARNYNSYWQDAHMDSLTIMPGITYKLSDKNEITFQYIFTKWEATNYLGLPIDPSSGTNTEARLLSGVPRDLSVYADDLTRTDQRHDWKLKFTGEIWKGLSVRLEALYRKNSQTSPQLNTGNSTGGTGGNRDPLTGIWNSGLQYAGAPTFASSPITTQPTRIFTRSGTYPRLDPRDIFIQNDYAYIWTNDTLKSTTLVGAAYSESENSIRTDNISAPNFNIDQYVDTPFTVGTLNSAPRLGSRFIQGYASETLSLLKDRLILNAAVAKNDYRQRATDRIANVTQETTPAATLPSYGIVIKPYQDMLSLYYSYSEQSTANGPFTPVNTNPELTSSQQDEFGVRLKLWEGKVYFTVSHFDITQDNYGISNPGNLTTPPPSPLLPNLFSDRTAKGWEYEWRLNPNKNLSIIGNYTAFKNRDPRNVEFRGTPEKSGGMLVSYTFDKENLPALSGFRAAVGVNYIGRRPGDAASGITAASTPTRIIPNLPTFYLPAYTLVNFMLAYNSTDRWGAQLNVDNVFNKEYLQASLNRSLVYVGTPTNVRLSLNYKF
jgi:iron complex outermembrane receptor protein